MNADQKRQLIDTLYFRAIDSAKLGNQVFEQLQGDIEKLKKNAEKVEVDKIINDTYNIEYR